MQTLKRAALYILIMSCVFTALDFVPIHLSYTKYGHWPDKSVDAWWPSWSAFRYNTALILCPVCAGFSEHLYFIPFEIFTTQNERSDLLIKHMPARARYEGVLSQSGFWWGQGGVDNSNPWILKPLHEFWLFWLGRSIIWLIVYAADMFAGRLPWWTRIRLPKIARKELA
jgi:hypothetical protein